MKIRVKDYGVIEMWGRVFHEDDTNFGITRTKINFEFANNRLSKGVQDDIVRRLTTKQIGRLIANNSEQSPF